MKNKWLLASDIDGTLLDRSGNIPQRNIDAIKKFVSDGGKFSIATGRSVDAIRHLITQVELNAPVIVLNGAAIYDYQKEDYVWGKLLCEKAIERTKIIKEKFPNIGIEIHVGTQVYIPTQHDVILRQMKYERLEFHEVDIDDVPANWYKVIFAGEEDEVNQIVEFVNNAENIDTEYVRSDYCYFEMLPKGCNKGTALKELAKICGVNQENTSAIGDYYNDVELLKAAALPAAAGQAPDDIKLLAKVQTCVCDNGCVADLINYIYFDEKS